VFPQVNPGFVCCAPPIVAELRLRLWIETIKDATPVGSDRDWGSWSPDVHHEGCATVEGGEQVVPLPERGEGGVDHLVIWVVPSSAIVASSPDEKDRFFDPAVDKVYRHPTFYDVPEGAKHL
jgi:Phenylacetic acid degradation B